MDGSRNHEKEKEGISIQPFQREKFMKGGNTTVSELLNLTDVWDVSGNADPLKAYLDRSFELSKTHSMDDNVLKKIISICKDRASLNIGYKNSFFTSLV